MWNNLILISDNWWQFMNSTQDDGLALTTEISSDTGGVQECSNELLVK